MTENENSAATTPDQKPQEENKEADRKERFYLACSALFAEYLLILLPLVVVTIVLLCRGKTVYYLLASPEWSFGSAILMGLTITKTVASTTKSSISGVYWQRVMFAVSCVIVFGLVPSLIVLSTILTTDSPSTILVWMQCFLFITSSLTFIILGLRTDAEVSAIMAEQYEYQSKATR